MYQILNPNNNGHGRSFAIPNLPTSRAVLLREIQRVMSFYHKQPTLVPVDHILVRVINLLTISMKRSDYSVVDACMERTGQVAKVLGLVHPLNANSVVDAGQFYNNHVNEIIIAHDSDEPDYEVVKSSWYTMSAVKILTHPFADINMHLCNGRYPSTGTGGYAVFVIDTPLLMLQYKYWQKRSINAGQVNSISPRHFVSQMVIPNLLIEHLDVCFINRAMRTYRKQATPFMTKVHPIQLANYQPKVDELIDHQVKALNDHPVDIRNTYTLFPAVLKASWLSSIQIPDIVPNMHTRWALELAALPYIDFLVEVVSDRNPQMVRQVSGEIRRDLRRMENNKEFKHVSPTLLSVLKLRLNES